MATFNKTVGNVFQAITAIASNTVGISPTYDVTTKIGGIAYIHFGRSASAALTQPMILRIEAAAKANASSTGYWFPIATFVTGTSGTNGGFQITTGASAGQNVATMTNTSGIGPWDIIFIQNTTLANSEWQRTKIVSANTSITLEENLVNLQNNTSSAYNQAEIFVAQLDFSAIQGLRLVSNGSKTGQGCVVESWLTTTDTFQ